MRKFLIIIFLWIGFPGVLMAQEKETIVIGSKMFNESYILAEITAQLLEENGYNVERRYGMGGTLVCYNALATGEIDLYPEYTATISEAILTADERPDGVYTIANLDPVLSSKGFKLFAPYGFNNTYALTIKKTLSEEKGIYKISDLRNHPDLLMSLSHEFINRDDGWYNLSEVYRLDFAPTGINHGLAYKAIDDGAIDITDAYTTDGDIERYGLVLLDDDLGYFPEYFGASFVRLDFPPDAIKIISEVENLINDDRMRKLSADVVINGKSFEKVANEFLIENKLVLSKAAIQEESIVDQLINNTLIHIKITLIALSIGCIIGLVAAFVIFRSVKISRFVIYFTGLLQTIPSIALLALMIPIFGIGELPAVIALFLYSLLPILRSAVTALTTIDPVLVNVSRAIGMTRFQQLRHVLFPLALPNILSGIKTAAVICIGTATLAAFIGAGGLGEPIVTGLALNDTNLILQGAIPAACLALIVELLFEFLEKRIIPDHLRAQ